MKKIILLALVVFFGFNATAQVTTYNVGDVVDDFTVTDTDGNEWNLYDITSSGQYVYLDFFFDTCGPCQVTTRIFNEFHDRYGCNEGDLFMISINDGTDTDLEVILFEEQYGGDFEHAPAVSAEGGSAVVDTAFGIGAYPTYCMIGPDNTLIVSDIWPLSGVETFEATFDAAGGITPAVDPCTEVMGVDENNQNLNFVLSPNPNNGNTLTVTLANMSGATIEIYNVLGKLLFQNSINNGQTTVSPNLSSGMYLVSVQTDDGAAAVQKLVVR